ncbi:MAG: hypothetical protein KGL40_10630 [Rhodocyclaceae bacterium]|nr:hypothetical protein [Rhodocyclaceae bacterium]
MTYPNSQSASFLAADMIEELLSMLALTIPAVDKSVESGAAGAASFDKLVRHRKLRLVETASGGNIVAEKAERPDKAGAPSIEFSRPPAQGKNDCLRILVGNSLVTVGALMQRHDMLDMRTPEFQFLGHVMNAVLNGNAFHIPAGYIPTASFDGLVLNAKLNGMPLFAEGTLPGFMELGDALALLQWLLRYLRGERGYVSGGDAG